MRADFNLIEDLLWSGPRAKPFTMHHITPWGKNFAHWQQENEYSKMCHVLKHSNRGHSEITPPWIIIECWKYTNEDYSPKFKSWE